MDDMGGKEYLYNELTNDGFIKDDHLLFVIRCSRAKMEKLVALLDLIGLSDDDTLEIVGDKKED